MSFCTGQIRNAVGGTGQGEGGLKRSYNRGVDWGRGIEVSETFHNEGPRPGIDDPRSYIRDPREMKTSVGEGS